MKKLIVLSVLALVLLAGCQNQEEPQGVVQMVTAVESGDLNATLRELHNQGMTIIDIKSWPTQRRVVYDIMYEESNQN